MAPSRGAPGRTSLRGLQGLAGDVACSRFLPTSSILKIPRGALLRRQPDGASVTPVETHDTVTNGSVEIFKGSFAHERWNEHGFVSPPKAQLTISAWQHNRDAFPVNELAASYPFQNCLRDTQDRGTAHAR